MKWKHYGIQTLLIGGYKWRHNLAVSPKSISALSGLIVTINSRWEIWNFKVSNRWMLSWVKQISMSEGITTKVFSSADAHLGSHSMPPHDTSDSQKACPTPAAPRRPTTAMFVGNLRFHFVNRMNKDELSYIAAAPWSNFVFWKIPIKIWIHLNGHFRKQWW